jgi:hypothetical protein
MISTIIVLLASWLGLNVAFVAIRLFLTSDHRMHAVDNLVRHPRLIN